MEEVDPLGAAPPPARPVQVRPHRHHAEDGAVDGVDAHEQKDIKTVSQYPVANVEAPRPLNANANDVGVG